MLSSVPLLIAIISTVLSSATGLKQSKFQWAKNASTKNASTHPSTCTHCQKVLDVSISPDHHKKFVHGEKKHYSMMLDPTNISGEILSQYDRSVADEALQALVAGAEGTWSNRPTKVTPFETVKISFPLNPPYIDHVPKPTFKEGEKNMIPPKSLAQSCVIYGAGIADDSSFETEMAALGCEVHAFDCTIPMDAPSVHGKQFTFHQWCIGKKHPMANNYSKGDDENSYVFKTLSETMTELGHTNVDALKFDIEGFEWDLFEDILISTGRPLQLAFELHTQGANPGAVPPNVVAGKAYREVSKLFLDLHSKGYRIISKEINPGDGYCAEFVLVNLETLEHITP